MEETFFEIRLDGEGIGPGLVRSKELAEVIESVEDMIASLVVYNNPELKKENIVIGLSSISRGSIGLQFAPNLTELTIPAAKRVAASLNNGDYSGMPEGTMKSLRNLTGFSKRHGCDIEIRYLNGASTTLAVMTPKTEIPVPVTLVGETILYGKITRVGGKEPKVQFTTIDDQIIYIKVDEQLARKAGSLIYREVAITGTAYWNSETMRIDEFKLESISGYKLTALPSAFNELKQLAGGAFDGIENVREYVTALRRDTVEG